jgi:hypothetical protein
LINGTPNGRRGAGPQLFRHPSGTPQPARQWPPDVTVTPRRFGFDTAVGAASRNSESWSEV